MAIFEGTSIFEWMGGVVIIAGLLALAQVLRAAPPQHAPVRLWRMARRFLFSS
jgi:hypothetical protein